MILDGLLTFDPNPTSMIHGTGNFDSTNILDVGLIGGLPPSASGGGARDMGISDAPIIPKFLCGVVTTFVGATAVFQVAIMGAPDNGSGSPGTFADFALSQAYPVASMLAGVTFFDIDMPEQPPGSPVPRFYKLQYRISTAALTAGSIFSYLILDRFSQPASTSGVVLSGYPAGVVVPN